ncbi:MAG: peptidase carboxypeptidase [Candidatus Saccharibacteria bacterium]|nr:peptidase carboxypeptidase [Candidatus Saccharibacteria bacterium]
MQIKQTVCSFFLALWAMPKRYTIPVAALVMVGIFYLAAFVIEKPVNFSYAGPTCTNRLTLLPQIHKSPNSSGYVAQPARIMSIGRWPIAARSVCVSATRAPQPGVAKVSLAPYGGVFARQTFAIKVDSPVIADTKVLDAPIPVSRPLKMQLTGRDNVFSYVLKIGDKQVDCEEKDAVLTCDIEKLELAQSKSYPTKLVRQFKGKDIAIVMSKSVQTLSAITITDTSIKANETVYAKPTEIVVTADKKIITAEVVLYRMEGEDRKEMSSVTAITETGYVVKISEELPRLMSYELVAKKVEAADGSGLVQAHALPFKVSGGPKVTGVNVGTTGVPINSTVVVSFDQSLSETQDVSKFVTLSGGATIVGKKGEQLLIAVSGVPKCGDFSIQLTGDLQSRYDIGGQSAWNYSGRTICHTIGTIGTSSQGRAINAYYFGSGATAVLYTGAIHGSESSTKLLMDRWIQELEAKARDIPAHMTVVVVPTVNPDGYARGSRVNARNVDLNRNFATSDWQKDITTVGNQPFPGGGGESAMSEPETKAIAALAQRLRPKVILSYHSIGGMVAANQAGNSTALAATYAQLSGYRNITGQSDTTFEYAVTGTADDWYAQAIGVPSLLIELGSHTYHQFERNQTAMWAMINS